MNYTTVNIQDEQQTRHEFLYGLQTMAVLFRNIRHKGFMSDSGEGKVILRFSHECSSAKDFLSYLLAVHETGQVMLQHGDVIGIKINGSIICYRYTEQGHTNKDLLIWNYFTEHKEFEKWEKEKYVTDLHKNNQVLDVLSGKVVNIDSIQFADTRICAIDQECYYPHGDRSSLIITDYFVYELKDMGIENINPYQRPFCDIKSAFMFFQHNKKKDRYGQRLLLLNRKELYLVRDYRHLLTIAL